MKEAKVRLLYVEDDLADQMSFRRFVVKEELPYAFEIVGSVADAREILLQREFDIVLTDQSLGDGTAFELLEFIPDALPVVFVTGTGNEANAVQAIKLGVHDYIIKDHDGNYLKLLSVTVEKVLNALKTQRELEAYRQSLESMVTYRTLRLEKEVSQRKEAELQLAVEKEQAMLTLQSIGDAVIRTDRNGCIEFINPAAEELTGWSADEARGLSVDKVYTIVDEKTREYVTNPVEACLASGTMSGLDEHSLLQSRLGREYSVQDSAAPIRGADGEIAGCVLVFSDETESRQETKELVHRASHDPLTGLMNRREFERRLGRVLDGSVGDTEHAFCYLDLDQFKVVNDTCGHTAGDELLKQVTALFKEKVRTRDSIARLGGDEFGVLLEDCPLDQAQRLANELLTTIANYRFVWEGKSFRIGVSIGLVPVLKKFSTLNDLLSTADAACYAAKNAGRNQIYVFQNDQDLARASGQVRWVSKIKCALDEKQFVLFRQPIHSLCGRARSFEVLIRIEDAGRLILPGAFISAAERYGLVPKIDKHVIDLTFSWLATHKEELELLTFCTINLAGQTLLDDSLPIYIHERRDYYGLPADKICFEVAEVAAITNLNLCTDLMTGLKNQGFRFALEDFGNSLSSFAYLKNLPVDFLKIDGVLVRDIVDDEVDRSIVRGINETGHLMGKKTIAEFVETDAVYRELKKIEVDYAQGYWLAKPERM